MTSPLSPPQFDTVLRGFDQAQVVRLIDRANAAFIPLTGAPAFHPSDPDAAPVTAAELRNAEPDTVLRGFDPTQVRSFLADLADRLAEAESHAGRG